LPLVKRARVGGFLGIILSRWLSLALAGAYVSGEGGDDESAVDASGYGAVGAIRGRF
jgi:hypothetical protein